MFILVKGILSYFCTKHQINSALSKGIKLIFNTVKRTDLSDDIIEEDFEVVRDYFDDNSWQQILQTG